MMFVSGADDVILVDESHSVEHLGILQGLGYELPERVVPAGESKLAQRRWSGFEPWGHSPEVARRLRRINGETLPLIDVVRRCSDKTLARKLRGEFLAQTSDPLWSDEKTWTVTDTQDLAGVLQQIADQGYELAVLKAPLGASGQQMKRLVAREPLTANIEGWARNVIRRQGALIIEPWL